MLGDQPASLHRHDPGHIIERHFVRILSTHSPAEAGTLKPLVSFSPRTQLVRCPASAHAPYGRCANGVSDVSKVKSPPATVRHCAGDSSEESHQ
jgi:hypothetical protein